MKARNILETIGNTPHVKINRLFENRRVEVWMKLERANPGGSIKDRIGLAMIEDAEHKGRIHKDTVIIEPTSGNTGIALAMVAAAKGYRLILTMPESMSPGTPALPGGAGRGTGIDPAGKGYVRGDYQGSGTRRRNTQFLDAAAVRERGKHRSTQGNNCERDTRRLSERF